MPFLTVITRTIPSRTAMLRKNIDSLTMQTDPDYQQLVLKDNQRRGVDWANGRMAERDWSDIEGDYVLVLDDDDLMIENSLIERMKESHTLPRPDLFILRMDHGPLGILPNDENWECEPMRACQGCSSVIPSRELFKRAVKHYAPQYDGDFDFVKACYDFSEKTYWLDIVATRVQQIGAFSPL